MPRGMRPNPDVGTKVDKKTWGKLLSYCKKYIPVIIVAMICAMCGTILTLLGPDILSSITDTIAAGIAPDTEKLSVISETMSENIQSNVELLTTTISDNTADNFDSTMTAISQNLASVEDMDSRAAEIMEATDISDEDKETFEAFMQALATTTDLSEAQALFMSLPMSINEYLYDDIEVNGQTITVQEQFDTIALFSNADANDSEQMTQAMAQLPESVLATLYSDITVNDIVISVEDQNEMIETMSEIDLEGMQTSNDEQALEDQTSVEANVDTDALATMDALNSLPQSVRDAIYTDITVDGVVIPGADQVAMMDTLSSIDSSDTSAALDSFDSLPASIYGLIKPTIDLEKIGTSALVLGILYLIGAALSAIQGLSMATITQKIAKSLRTNISTKINRIPMKYYQKNTTGDVLSRVTNDVDTIGMTLNMSIGTLVTSVTLFVGSLIMMLKTNVIMTLTGVGATILGFVLMFLIMGRSQKYFTRQQKHLGSLDGHIEEIFSGHTVVKAYNGEKKAVAEFKVLNDKLRDSGFKAQALSGLMMPIMNFIGNFGYVAVCLVGAALVLDGKITFGVIVSFMIYIRFFTQPLFQIAQAAQSLQSAGAASARVFEFIDAQEMEDESEKVAKLTDVKGNVSFSHVKFGYDPDKIIIKDFSAEAKAGQKIAIVGPTGAGKTTLVNLLMRFYEINSGEIMIDGVPTNSIKREEVHSQFCMVLQDTWLFEGTVKENLVYCSDNDSEDDMKRACKAVGLDHFIRTLPKGYDTILDDNVNLSQGQKQQLTIARAMIADKPILILDEATSSIDTRTELKIQSAMDQLMKDRTSFVIAHRLSTIKNADLILVLNEGDVIESGNHEELMAKNGFYADLYNSQFEQVS